MSGSPRYKAGAWWPAAIPKQNRCSLCSTLDNHTSTALMLCSARHNIQQADAHGAGPALGCITHERSRRCAHR